MQEPCEGLQVTYQKPQTLNPKANIRSPNSNQETIQYVPKMEA